MNQRTSFRMMPVIVFFLMLLNLAGQEPVPPVPSPNAIQSPAIPDTSADWNMEIRTSGGFDGQGSRGFALTSAGRLTCNTRTPCSLQIPPAELRPLNGLVSAMDFLAWIRTPISKTAFQITVPAGSCFDCIVTTMVLSIRDSNGIEWSYTATWDPTTQSSVPADFKRIFQAAIALTK